MYYIHSDNLGSINFITNSSGSTVQELSYDAWGRQRNATDWGYSNLPAPKFERGYTFHEQLDGFDLVNMNGRMYDPMLGRMLSPDPVVQSPGNLQNYNRYSYALNNPLKYTDPTGYQVYNSGIITNGAVELLSSGWLGNQSFTNTYFGHGPGGGGYSYGAPGGDNGPGLDGVYYDWYSGTHRSTEDGSVVNWRYAYNIASKYGTSLPANTDINSLQFGSSDNVGGIWFLQHAYAGIGNDLAYKESKWRFIPAANRNVDVISGAAILNWGKMYIISNVNANAGLKDGHAWIRLESNKGVTTTMSLWGNRGKQEFWTNLEINGGYGAVSKSTTITPQQYNMIIDYNSNASNINWTPWNTCAGYSVGVWNYVTGDNLSATDYFWFTTPRSLAGSIKKNP